MINNYTFFKPFLFALALLSAQMLPAQWETSSFPGDENIQGVYDVNGVWVIVGETGCYRSINDGLSWSKTLNFDVNYGSTSTQSGNDIYVLDYEQRLYKSSNQGASWDLLSNPMPSGSSYPDGLAVTDQYILFETYNALYRYNKNNPTTAIAVLDFAPLFYPNTLLMQADGNEIWVAVKDSLLHSIDEGSTWDLVYEGHRANGLAVHGDTIMITTPTGIQRSVNNGSTWTTVYTWNQTSRISWQAGRWFSNLNGDLIYSSDGGDSWKAYSNLLDKNGVSIFSIAQKGTTTLLGTSVGIVRSTDQGNYWEVRNTGITSDDPSSSFGVKRLYILGDYLALNNSFSEDNGATWFRPLIDANYLSAPYTEYQGDYFAVDYDQKLYRSVGDLRHWQSTGVQFTPGISHRLLSAGANFYMFEYDTWNGTPATIYKSVDNGLHWTPTGGITNNVIGIVAKGDYLFEWRGFNGLFRSQNGGISWQSVGAGLSELNQGSGGATVFTDGNHVFVYNYNAIMVSNNNGLTFTKISNNLLNSFGFPTGAEYLTSDGNYVVIYDYEGVFLSQGLNDQWFNITGNLPNLSFYDASLVLHNGNLIFDSGYNDQPLWKRSIADLNLAQFDGQIYHDDNNNGIQEPGEQPYSGAIIQGGSSSFATSNPDGGYNLFAALDNDTLRVKKTAPWIVVNPEFYKVSGSESGKSFGIYFPQNITDLKIDLTNETVFRPGFQENIYLSYTNFGTIDSDAEIRFVANAPLEFEAANPAPDAIIGDTLFWNLQNLAVGSSGKIFISVKTPVSTSLGSLVTAFASISSTESDENLVDNQSYMAEIVVGSYDPNDKRCNLPKITPEQLAAGELLTYTIRFQNTGTYPATFVRVVDTLDFERLDISTFQVLAASHSCQTTLRGNGELVFFFDQIDLPPSDFNEPASHGFIKFSVRPKANLPLGQQIQNTGHIYFDYNPAIVTNTTVTSVAETVGTYNSPQHTSNQPLTIYPNPSAGIVEIQTDEVLSGTLRIFNAFGTVVLERNGFVNFEKVDLASLPAGAYSVEFQVKTGQQKKGKLIKIK